MSGEEKRKNEIVSKLRTICSCGELKEHEREWILQAIDYIRGQNND